MYETNQCMRALLACLVAVPACCMQPQAAHPRMSAGTGVTARTPIVVYEQVTIASPSEGPPAQEITVVDLMPYIHSALEASGMRDGSVNLISRHTTTAITINEWESRLVRDIRAWLLRLAPPDDRSAVGEASAGVAYLHNDIDTRPESEARRFVSRLCRPRVASSPLAPGPPRRAAVPRLLCRRTRSSDASTTGGRLMTRTSCSAGATRSRSTRTATLPLCCSASPVNSAVLVLVMP